MTQIILLPTYTQVLFPEDGVDSADLVDDLSHTQIDTETRQCDCTDAGDSIELSHPLDHVVQGCGPGEVHVFMESEGDLPDGSLGSRSRECVVRMKNELDLEATQKTLQGDPGDLAIPLHRVSVTE